MRKSIINRSLVIIALPVLIHFFYVRGFLTDKQPLYLAYPVNTKGDDFAPSFTSDGRIMIFNSREIGEEDHNIFMCRLENGSWSRPEPIKELNTEFNEETPFISGDGSEILFASDREKSLKPSATSDRIERVTYDIYYSELREGAWTAPLPLPGEVNTAMNERAPALSRDMKTLYFTRWPYKNMGKSTIMAADFRAGVYVNTRELPYPVNTGNYEMAMRPAMTREGFYFSSMRPGGFGGWDIYFVDNKNDKFGAVVNMGSGINSPANDLFFSDIGGVYYFCSNRAGGFGMYDIYSTGIPVAGSMKQQKEDDGGEFTEKKSIRELSERGPEKSPGKTRIDITVLEEKTGKPLSLPFTVYLKDSQDPSTRELRTVKRRSDSNGKFSVIPRQDVKYLVVKLDTGRFLSLRQQIEVEKNRARDITIVVSQADQDYSETTPTPGTESMKSVSKKKNKTINLDKTVPLMESGFAFQNIYFDSNSSMIRLEYYPYIHSVIDYLRSNRSARLLITGYCDWHGKEYANKILSVNRAASVRDYLLRMGIDENRVQIRSAEPPPRPEPETNKNLTEANRRVEFAITAN